MFTCLRVLEFALKNIFVEFSLLHHHSKRKLNSDFTEYRKQLTKIHLKNKLSFIFKEDTHITIVGLHGDILPIFNFFNCDTKEMVTKLGKIVLFTVGLDYK